MIKDGTKDKVRILFHLNQAGYGGTEKAILTFCQNIDRSQFDVHLFITQQLSPFRRAKLKLFRHISQRQQQLYQARVVTPWVRLAQFEAVLGKEQIHIGRPAEFPRICRQLSPDIIHFNRGKWDKFFRQVSDKIPEGQLFVETNIFGYPAPATYHERIRTYFFVSHWLMNKSPWHEGKGRVLVNPIKYPATEQSLRAHYNIPNDAFVFGRISRPDLNDDDFIIRAFERVPDTNCYLFILAPTQAIREAKRSDKIILLDPTTSETELSRFYNSLDVLLHYRREGETFGMNIAEAMLHGVPVISHDSEVDNAQLELLDATEDGEVGLIAPLGDIEAYSNNMRSFLADRARARQAGENAKRRAARLYGEDTVTRTLEGYYRELLATR